MCLILNLAMEWRNYHLMFPFGSFFYHFMNLFSSNFQTEFSFWGLFRFLFPHPVPQTCIFSSTPSLQVLELVAYWYIYIWSGSRMALLTLFLKQQLNVIIAELSKSLYKQRAFYANHFFSFPL